MPLIGKILFTLSIVGKNLTFLKNYGKVLHTLQELIKLEICNILI